MKKHWTTKYIDRETKKKDKWRKRVATREAPFFSMSRRRSTVFGSFASYGVAAFFASLSVRGEIRWGDPLLRHLPLWRLLPPRGLSSPPSLPYLSWVRLKLLQEQLPLCQPLLLGRLGWNRPLDLASSVFMWFSPSVFGGCSPMGAPVAAESVSALHSTSGWVVTWPLVQLAPLCFPLAAGWWLRRWWWRDWPRCSFHLRNSSH